jgi:hypothetical protein
MMAMMYMHFYWGCNFVFLLSTWQTQVGQCGKYTWYIVLAVILTALTDLIPLLKDYILATRKESDGTPGEPGKSKLAYVLLLLLIQGLWILFSILVMLLIMSFNYGIVIAIIVTKTVVYSITTIPKLLAGASAVTSIIKAEEFNAACH